MKAHTPISSKMRTRLIEEQEKLMKNVIRRFLKIICVTLNEEFGFGSQRLARLILQFADIAEVFPTDEEYWYHIDERLKQLGLEFEDEDYDELGEFKKIRGEKNA